MSSKVSLVSEEKGHIVDLPVLEGTLGRDVLDVQPLVKTPYFTFDPGFLATASCESKITFIDGERGQLYHRGYPIEQLAEFGSYLEVCFLLMHGELPTPEQKHDFERTIMDEATLPEQLVHVFDGFHQDTHPMAMMMGAVSALSAHYQDGLDIDQEEHRKMAMYSLVSKIPTVAAMCYRHSIGASFVPPRRDLSYAANFLHMMFAAPGEDDQISPTLEEALDRIFILHADHGQNASTSTVRLAGSSGANPFACIVAGIACLWGPAHGGANEAVLNMLSEIGDEKNIDEFIQGVQEKRHRLMGFGHRVYKNMDPRANIMRETCHKVLDELGLEDDMTFKLAMRLEKIALEDPYFTERRLYPNVDFYSGIVLKAMGIPLSMFTVVFALARTVGWIAHWSEMMGDANQKIGRPRQLYTGYACRHYVSLEQR